MKMKLFKSLSLAAALGLLASCAKLPENEIRIGEFGSMTGLTSTFGTATHEGIQLAVDEVNAAGGINGKLVKLVSEDDRGKPEEAATVVEKLITRDHVHALLGEVASSNSLAAAPIAQRHKIPMISPSSTNPKVTAQGDYIFRVCFIDPFQGKVMAKFASETLHAKTAAILRDKSSDYSVGLADVFAREFSGMGGKILIDQAYQSKDVDFKSQLTTIRQKKPDVLFVPGYYSEVGLIAKQARDGGLQAPLLGGDGWESPELYAIGGKAIEGSYFSNHCAPDAKIKQVMDFAEKHRAKYKKEPGALTVLGYDAAGVLFDAIRHAPSLKGPDLRAAIAATKDYQGVSGAISLDADRNAVKSAVVLKVHHGRAEFVATVNP
ncbi:MAG: ABC transporter substrate-binding protein [candidate division FCPU426 bacterium]